MRPPYLPYDRIRGIVDDFWATHCPGPPIPVPIENVIEQCLGLDIIPIPGLRDSLGRDGYLRLDRTGIAIDSQLLEDRYLTRYNFTLAHEAGHLTMHAQVYEDLAQLSLDGWYDLHLYPTLDMAWFERHADDFAGLVLVPTSLLLGQHLNGAVEAEGRDAIETCLALGVSAEAALDMFSVKVCERLGRIFEAHATTVQIRLKREQRWPVLTPDDL